MGDVKGIIVLVNKLYYTIEGRDRI